VGVAFRGALLSGVWDFHLGVAFGWVCLSSGWSIVLSVAEEYQAVSLICPYIRRTFIYLFFMCPRIKSLD